MSYEDYFKRVEEARETELEQSKNIVGVLLLLMVFGAVLLGCLVVRFIYGRF